MVCEQRLPPLNALGEPSIARMRVPTSRVVVEIQFDAPALLGALESSVPKRVAAARGVHLGDPGRLSYVVDRGPFVARIDGDSLVVETQVEAAADVCKPLGLLGCVEYASCRPGAVARAKLPLLLEPTYRFPSPVVQIPVTRRCTLTALDIDVTGRVQHEADLEAGRLRARIEHELPDLGPAAAQLWSLLTTSVPIGGGRCVRVFPTAVVQTGPHGDATGAKTLSMNVGVEGEIVVETCRSSPARPPLPAPRLDRSLSPGAALEVGQLITWDEVGRSMVRTLGSPEVRLGSETTKITDVRAAPGLGGRMNIAVTIAGKTCGEIRLEATPVATPTGDGITLADVHLAPFELERVSGTIRRFDAHALEQVIGERGRLPLPLEAFVIPRQLDAFTSRLLGKQRDGDGGPLDLDVSVTSAKLTSVQPSADGLLAIVDIRGDTRIRVRTPP